MKKVLIVAALLAMTASPALAGIKNSPHDLSNAGTSGQAVTSNSSEVCVFCHTPHNADTSVTLAPLWNRSTKNLSTVALYNSGSLSSASKPSVVSTEVDKSDATLCLSCHDGSSLATNLKNNPADAPTLTFTGPNTVGADMVLLDGSNGLTNDHPIGMVYNSVVAAKPTEFNVASTPRSAGIKFFDNGHMWCSSCHNVHDYSTNPPFLNDSISGSKLCLDCHNK